MKPLTETERNALELAILLAQTSKSELISDGRKVRCLTLKHTIERLGSIEALVRVVLS